MTSTSTDHKSTSGWLYIEAAYSTSGTTAQITDILSKSWLWEPPPLPEIRIPLPRRTPDAPHIPRRYSKMFTGNKFRLGGNKV